MHVCPMVTGLVPHVGGPILPPGCPTVLIGLLPAARMGDMATCVGPPDSIAMGSPTVMIGNMMAARIGDPTVHGGVIVAGCPTVIIGEVGMGGAGSALGAAMATASASGVPCVTPPADSATPPPQEDSSPDTAPPASFYAGASGSAPATQVSQPPPQQASATKAKEIICGLKMKSASLSCQHGGRTPKKGLLEVVPSAGGDTISCKSDITGTCGQHPVWEIGGYWTSKKIGQNVTFNARDFEGLLKARLALPVWLGDIEPHTYDVSVSSCNGPSYSFQLNAYPKDSQEFSLDPKLWEEEFKPISDGVKKFLQTFVPKPIFEFLKGQGQCSLQWTEEEKGNYSNLAFYQWKLTLGFAPLLAVGFRLPFGPTAPIPQALLEYGNAYLFFEAKGELNLKMDGGQLHHPLSGQTHFDLQSENSLLFAVGGSVFLGGDEDDAPLKIEVAIQTGAKLELKGQIVESRPEVDGEIKIGGLKGSCTFHFMFYEKKSECTFFDDVSLWEKTFHPFASPESGAE